MRLIFALQLPALFFTFALGAPAPEVTPTSSAPAAQSTICGDIVTSCSAYLSLEHIPHKTLTRFADETFTAKQAYDCLTSVPFNPAIATRFLKYYNDTIQFQSTLAYLKNPPSSYQQPAVDLLAGFEQIQKDIDNGAFPNQYAFEATLQNLVYSAHDAHFQLETGILAAFTFLSPYALVALSEDGVQLPKVYTTDDALSSIDPSSDFKPSAIKTINGQDVTTYLTQFGAANSVGNLEPNADWNDLMSSYAAYIQDDYSILESYVEFYPGETITLGFENGTTLDPEPWLAIYNSPGPTGPLATGGDFYNFFVLGFYPASFDPNATDPCAASDGSTSSSDSATTTVNSTSTNTSSTGAGATATSWPDTAYPDNTDIYQPSLYPDGGGFLTGYLLKDIATAVLSIPTFDMADDDVQTFSDTVQKFLNASHAAGMTKVLIDLQQNLGGDTLLAVDTFKHFFPANDTFRGSRLRAHPSADVIGNTFTTYYQTNQSANSSVYDALSASDWVATDRLNAETGQNFTSWGEFFGPHQYNGDNFTTVERENITSSLFDNEALGIDIYGASVPATNSQLYDPENIILLSDGLCSSACAVFVEMMHHDAGVKSVVVGGLPQTGPMQIASGGRGAQIYTAENIDDDIAVAEYFNATTAGYLPDREEDVWISFMSVNLRDQIRKDQEDVPVQFLYDAADCRIFYTAETASNYTSLWTYAVNAISDPKLCVAGSTGFSTTGTNSQAASPPPTSKTPGYNASSVLGTSNQFTNMFTGPELDIFHPHSSGDQRKASQACNNHGMGCSVGRCNFKTSDGQHSYNGRKITFRSGTCPSTTSASSAIGGLITKNNEPAEIHGDGGKKKANPVANAIVELYGSP